MKIRKAKRNEVGGIDCEIDHPKYGWIPFTASPIDIEEHGRMIYKEIERSGVVGRTRAEKNPRADGVLDG